jgi:excinuclease ABC subunit A
LPDENLSINEGGIAPLGSEREAFIFRQVQTLSRKHKFSLDKPVKELPEKIMNLVVVWQRRKEGGELQYDDAMDLNVYSGEFEGIVNQVKRWFATSTSEAIQRWAEGFMELTTCKTCNGARLKKESLWFKVDEKNIAELSNLDLVQLVQWFDGIEKRLSDTQKRIGSEVIKEIRERLQFLLDVGLTYLSLNRPDTNAQRRRIAAHPAGYANRFAVAGHHLCAGRAFHRPAPARQPPPDYSAAKPARHWQQRAGGGARQRHYAGRRPPD